MVYVIVCREVDRARASIILGRVIMAYDRRNLNLYHRGGGGGAPLPSSYRNKALLIVGATALYTAFLYHSGMLSTTGTARMGARHQRSSSLVDICTEEHHCYSFLSHSTCYSVVYVSFPSYHHQPKVALANFSEAAPSCPTRTSPRLPETA